MFEGRKIIIATMHGKEKVIAPILESGIAVNCFVPENYNTDVFGTFSGEVERTSNPIETVRAKCLLAMNNANYDLGIASEGSFGPHPGIFFANADDEIIIFIDKKNNLEIITREISLDTNFSGSIINNYEELVAFANIAKFPSHALILKKAENNYSEIIKGIRVWEDLKISYTKLTKKSSTVYVETDMRAMYNPSRMKVIEEATKKLLIKINSKCPNCSTPGFDITATKLGLNCSLCACETRSVKSLIYSCNNCHYEIEKMYPNDKKWEDPMYCDYCNP